MGFKGWLIYLERVRKHGVRLYQFTTNVQKVNLGMYKQTVLLYKKIYKLFTKLGVNATCSNTCIGPTSFKVCKSSSLFTFHKLVMLSKMLQTSINNIAINHETDPNVKDNLLYTFVEKFMVSGDVYICFIV